MRTLPEAGGCTKLRTPQGRGSLVAEKERQVFRGEALYHAFVGSHDRVCQVALLLLKLENLLFDGVRCDEAVCEHLLRLTDSVRAVDSLCLDGWVPPRIEEEDIVGGSDREPNASCLQADQEGGAARSTPQGSLSSRVVTEKPVRSTPWPML